VSPQFLQLLEHLETVQKLDGALRWLPIEEFDFDLSCLRDAEVIKLSWNNRQNSGIISIMDVCLLLFKYRSNYGSSTWKSYTGSVASALKASRRVNTYKKVVTNVATPIFAEDRQ
jgi:hypothetical protein